jgi:hypothetical protein
MALANDWLAVLRFVLFLMHLRGCEIAYLEYKPSGTYIYLQSLVGITPSSDAIGAA